MEGGSPRNTVPGEFAEWFDGGSLSNRGMYLSPWTGAKYLWAVAETVGGLERLSHERPSASRAASPEGWQWVAAARVHWGGRRCTYVDRSAQRHDLRRHAGAFGRRAVHVHLRRPRRERRGDDLAGRSRCDRLRGRERRGADLRRQPRWTARATCSLEFRGQHRAASTWPPASLREVHLIGKPSDRKRAAPPKTRRRSSGRRTSACVADSRLARSSSPSARPCLLLAIVIGQRMGDRVLGQATRAQLNSRHPDRRLRPEPTPSAAARTARTGSARDALGRRRSPLPRPSRAAAAAPDAAPRDPQAAADARPGPDADAQSEHPDLAAEAAAGPHDAGRTRSRPAADHARAGQPPPTADAEPAAAALAASFLNVLIGCG